MADTETVVGLGCVVGIQVAVVHVVLATDVTALGHVEWLVGSLSLDANILDVLDGVVDSSKTGVQEDNASLPVLSGGLEGVGAVGVAGCTMFASSSQRIDSLLQVGLSVSHTFAGMSSHLAVLVFQSLEVMLEVQVLLVMPPVASFLVGLAPSSLVL